jgi:hypothetical protein
MALVGCIGVSLAVLALVFVMSESGSRYHWDTGEGLEFWFSWNWIEKTLAINNGGVISGVGESARFSRFGAAMFAIERVSYDPVSSLVGVGLGSTIEGVGVSSLVRSIGIAKLDASAFSILLLESGWVGLALYVAPILVLILLCLRAIRDRQSQEPNLQLLAVMVVLFGFCTICSVAYNNFALLPRGGGIFWLLAGLWYSAKKHRTKENKFMVLDQEQRVELDKA